MTSSLYRLCRQKRRLFHIAVRRCSDYDWAKYKQCRNRCTEEPRKARSRYLSEKQRQIVEEEDGSHRWWALAKRLCGITQAKQPMANFEDNGVVLSSALDKANLLARFFLDNVEVTLRMKILSTRRFPYLRHTVCSLIGGKSNVAYVSGKGNGALIKSSFSESPPHCREKSEQSDWPCLRRKTE